MERPRRVAISALACALALAGALGCSDDGSRADAGADGPAIDADAAVDALPACGTAGTKLPPGVVELAWDDGQARSHLRAGTMKITIDNKNYELAKVPLTEAVRFELEHPARIHGFAIQWANVPEGAPPEQLLQAGLYRDFGYNGFDHWAKAPLWQGTRCVRDRAADSWLTYVFDAPVEIEEPGLIYVAHASEQPTEPLFAFDDRDAACDSFDACRSAVRLPIPTYYDGLSFSFRSNFMVRLYVEYTEELAPEARIFQPSGALAASGKQISWGDYDGDGWDDALVGKQLFRNDQGSFVDVTDASGLGAIATKVTGGVWGDYDNDGCLDLFLYANSHTDSDLLMRSKCDGTFADVTAAAGVIDEQSANPCGDPAKNIRSPSVAAGWVDLDSDGFIDLYVANYSCGAEYTYYADTVFHNMGDGTFETWSELKGFSSAKTASRGVAPADIDGDGDVDLFINNYRLQANFLFVNNGDGSVTESAATAGVAGAPTSVGSASYYGHTIGAAWGDLDNDGDLDLVAANLAHPRFYGFSNKTQLLLNDGKGGFNDVAGSWEQPWSASGLAFRETHSVPLLVDVDQDGNLDLAITAVYDGRPTDFYWGKGDGTFELDAYHAGITTEDGWGIAAADVDHDGDADLYASGLFLNTLPAAKKGAWLQVRAIGNAGSNRAALGATVRVTAGGRTYVRHVQGGSGQGGQDSMYLHFGLGAAASASAISVTFPGNKKVDFSGPFDVNQRLWLFEDGTKHSGWSPPG